jgi:glucose/arabinose dehydrogenase
MVKYIFCLLTLFCLTSVLTDTNAYAESEDDYYRIVSIMTPKAQTESRSQNWKPAPGDLVLEVSGIAVLDDQRIAVAIRKGEIWILDGVYDEPPKNVTYKRFATALHEPLGLIWKDGAFYTVQRSELTRIRDTDGDGTADEYLTVAKGWGVTGHYHEYAYGPKLDHEGNLWLTLNIGLGLKKEHKARAVKDPTLGFAQGRWRGWGMKVTPDGELVPVCAGMRSPAGIGVNRAGDVFYTDQQGNWVATNTLHHMRKGAFFHHVEALASMSLPGSPIQGVKAIPNGLPFPEAIKQMPQLKPPAVWFPYKKAGQSTTDVMLDNSGGKFGPFDGQFFVGEFTQAAINRVFLEQVDGEYQGACFPFREGFASAVLRLAQGTDGSMFVGLTNRGWSSLGTASYGLQRLVWTGKTPFEIKEMRAKPDGFELVFTQPVDPKTAMDPRSYQMKSYTYTYHSSYGSDEILNRELPLEQITVSEDGTRVHLKVNNLRELYVHELVAAGVKNKAGQSLLHPQAYYTLNKIPKK